MAGLFCCCLKYYVAAHYSMTVKGLSSAKHLNVGEGSLTVAVQNDWNWGRIGAPGVPAHSVSAHFVAVTSVPDAEAHFAVHDAVQFVDGSLGKVLQIHVV